MRPLSPRETWFGLSAEALGPLRVYLRTLEKVAKRYALPDVDFVLNPLDARCRGPPSTSTRATDAGARMMHVGEALHHGREAAPAVARAARSIRPRGRRSGAHGRAWRRGAAQTCFCAHEPLQLVRSGRARASRCSRACILDAVDAAITAWPQPHGGNLSVLKRALRARRARSPWATFGATSTWSTSTATCNEIASAR